MHSKTALLCKQSGLSILSRKEGVPLLKRLFCLCIVLAIILCGCQAKTTKENTSTHTTISAVASTSNFLNTATTDTTTSAASSHTTFTEDVSAPTQDIANTTNSAQSSAHTTVSDTAISTTIATPSASSTTTTTPTAGTTTAPVLVTFTATVRNDQRQPVSNVIVSVWASDDILIGYGTTDDKGVARCTLISGSIAYRVTLSNLPAGYEADAEYRFSSTTVNITIRKTAVQNEKDHSQAQYKEGQKMTDFSLTDIDGDTYRLSSLLSQKQLIILDFWYTTCEPCKTEFPYFESAVQKYGDKLALLAINPINDERAMKILRQQLNASNKTAISFPMMKDTCNLYLGFAVTAYPVTVFIDSNGVILDIHQGAFDSEKDFFAAVERYLH